MQNTVDAEEKEQVKEDPKYLAKVRDFYAKQNSFASSTIERIEKLMQRKSARKWESRKIAKMVRRLANAGKIREQTGEVVDNINYRLSQIEKIKD